MVDFIVTYNELGKPTYYLNGIKVEDDKVGEAINVYGMPIHYEEDW